MYEDEGLSSYILNEDNLDSLEQLLDTNYLFINFLLLNLMIMFFFYQKYIIINLFKILKNHFY